MQTRSSGILLHVSSLMGPYGIGVFGKDTLRFIDFLKEAGFRAWQVLPFTIPDECNSPYKSVSAFAGNPYFIDPEQLFEEGLITGEELESCKASSPYSVDFIALKAQRSALFAKAFERITPALREKVEKWCAAQSWAADHALYTALQEETGKSWTEWPEPLRRREPQALEEARARLKPAIEKELFLQYLFFTQWQAVRRYANERGVKIIGDMPIYVALDSVDVWSNQQLFDLDEKGFPAAEAGVPPDYFSADGQRWGNPLYDWDAMKKDGYCWWISRITHAHALFDKIRIDHFRGFSAYWAVPTTAETAKEGAWRQGPGMDFFNILFKYIDREALIAEDLGIRDEGLEQLLEDTGLPGMRVMQFAFIGQDDGMHLPHNYLPNTVAYTGTHDNNTLLGYLWELTPENRRYCLDYCGFEGTTWKDGGAQNPAIRAILRTLWASPAKLIVVPIQDLLGYGGDTKMNRPGIAEGNWSYRLTEEAFAQLHADTYRRLSILYNR
ncbi:MAG: 4-alpha-glucanotransferase [Clostridia bacterium]|nr:4-alpha-glucanotransferase [Clostridia bacterium]MBQ8893230.1 4-alpha-glucanotransferase [Clostridia bacterium]